MSRVLNEKVKVLLAEDDVISRKFIKTALEKWGYSVKAVSDGERAWNILKEIDSPQLTIFDWMMPEMSGIELCKKIRKSDKDFYTYIIMLTSLSESNNIVDGLDAGADDYMVKPFNLRELRARIQVGVRVLDLERTLTDHVNKLEEALKKVDILQGLIPICAYCKKIRNDENYWQQVEDYISKHSKVKFSHGICPECYEKYVEPDIVKLESDNAID